MCCTEPEVAVTPDSEPGGDHTEESASSTDVIRPHERRAINFLLNEYLLINDYKLTSVTFAEENENQVLSLLYS